MSGLSAAIVLPAAAAAIAVCAWAARRTLPRIPAIPGTRVGWTAAPVLSAALALVVLAGLLSLVAAHDLSSATSRSSGRTVAALDVSGSVASSGLGGRIRQALDTVAAESGGRAGLVIFADDAAAALPPSAPARELTRLARFFTVTHGPFPSPSIGAMPSPEQMYLSRTPWNDAFVGGTVISDGIDLAARMLAPLGGGRIVVISDLKDGEGSAPLRQAIARANKARIQVAALPVGSSSTDIASFRRVGGVIAPGEAAHGHGDAGLTSELRAASPLLVAVVATTFALLLVGFYVWASPLRFAGRRVSTS